MRINNGFPVLTMEGTVSNSTIVFTDDGKNNNFARAKVTPKNPQTPDQLKIRAYMSAATKQWFTLPRIQMEAWEEYAKDFFKKDDEGHKVKPSGIATYMRANSVRQILGLPLITVAPTLAPPTRLSEVLQNSSGAPNQLGLELVHTYTTLTGFQVLVRMSAAMVTLGRTPLRTDMRFVRGVSPNSAAALPASGGTVSFTPTRFEVEEGERYGVEVRVVRTADGITSSPVFGDFIKAV
jgi:hypothetical protein